MSLLEDVKVKKKSKSAKSTIQQRFASAIKKRRLELQLSQDELAEAAEVDRTYVSMIERCSRMPKLDNVEKLVVHGLGMEIGEFFSKYVDVAPSEQDKQ